MLFKITKRSTKYNNISLRIYVYTSMYCLQLYINVFFTFGTSSRPRLTVTVRWVWAKNKMSIQSGWSPGTVENLQSRHQRFGIISFQTHEALRWSRFRTSGLFCKRKKQLQLLLFNDYNKYLNMSNQALHSSKLTTPISCTLVLRAAPCATLASLYTLSVC